MVQTGRKKDAKAVFEQINEQINGPHKEDRVLLYIYQTREPEGAKKRRQEQDWKKAQ